MELNTGLETGVVAIGLVVMLGMAVWLFFRRDSNGEQSLFLTLMSPNDDELEKAYRSRRSYLLLMGGHQTPSYTLMVTGLMS